MSGAKVLRCAIYTRVSSDGGLDQEFNSLDAQREASEAYIKSQAHEGWRLRREHYDDGGFSGGSMERPALQKLLAAVSERRLDIIVVYKVDRLTRSLADFAKLVELFDSKGVSFVSVTQSFNTTTSMGRLTLNVLLSFAQFEREVTGERIRDKIAASKKKGIWMGGPVPLGYRVEQRKLLVEEAEAETVRLIFRSYLELGSLPALQRDLRDRGIRTRVRTLATGKVVGGVALTNGPLSHLLRNRTYLGELNHRGISHKGEHQAIVALDLFEAVQARLAENLTRRASRNGRSHALLAGCLFDDRGNAMSPSNVTKRGICYHYYVSTALVQGRTAEAGSIARVSAQEIETLVVDALRAHRRDRFVADATVTNEQLKEFSLRVEVQQGRLQLSWCNQARSDDGEAERQTVEVAYRHQPHKRHREILLPANASSSVRPMREQVQRDLIAAIAQGRAWLQETFAGMSLHAIALREGKSDRSVRMTLSLAFLDPKLVQAALHGTLPRGASARSLTDAPLLWHAQWRTLGLSRPL